MSTSRKNGIGYGIFKKAVVRIGVALGKGTPFPNVILSEAEGSPISFWHHPLCHASGHGII